MYEVSEWAKPAFEIVLDAPHYFPGDVITGCVKRRAGNAGLVTPHALVQLQFFGRTIIRFDNNRTVLRPDIPQTSSESDASSEINIIDKRYTLHDGPLHIPMSRDRGSSSWSFAIPLPLHPSPTCTIRGQHEIPFLSLHPNDVETHGLPFTFNDREMLHTTSCPAYVEYGLMAEISEEHGGHRTETPKVSIALVKVRPPPAPPIIDSALCHRESRRMVQTHRLTQPNHHLSLLQKTKEVFQLSHVPYYLFNVQVNYPTTIQLDSLSPVPFLLRIGPPREGDVNAPSSVLANSMTRTTLPFRLTGIMLKLKAFTAVNLLRHRYRYPEHEKTLGELTVRWNPDSHPGDDAYSSSNNQAAPIIPDCSSRDGQDENLYNSPPMMDVGELIDLRFGPREAKYMGKTCKMESPLYPDFVTYNIKHRHVLRWELTMTLAKETLMMIHEAAVVVIPSCSWS